MSASHQQPSGAIHFAPDGCVLPNIRLQNFRVIFVGRCGHVNPPRITVDIRSVSQVDARRQALAVIGTRSLYVHESTETII